jgi:hypothetical protein
VSIIVRIATSEAAVTPQVWVRSRPLPLNPCKYDGSFDCLGVVTVAPAPLHLVSERPAEGRL